jgi:hypothetical protein
VTTLVADLFMVFLGEPFSAQHVFKKYQKSPKQVQKSPN